MLPKWHYRNGVAEMTDKFKMALVTRKNTKLTPFPLETFHWKNLRWNTFVSIKKKNWILGVDFSFSRIRLVIWPACQMNQHVGFQSKSSIFNLFPHKARYSLSDLQVYICLISLSLSLTCQKRQLVKSRLRCKRFSNQPTDGNHQTDLHTV